MRLPFGTIDNKTLQLARGWLSDPLASGQLTEGPLTREFEKQFAKKFGYKHGIMTTSGTTAGHVVWSAIRDLSRKPWAQAKVITPACAFAATANVILTAGLLPRFVDVDLETLNINPALLPESEENTIGVQFVANIGRMADIDKIESYAKLHEIWMVADLCEGHGGSLDGRHKFGDAAIWSFYPAHITVAAEGGMICTDDDELADLCRSVKSHGRPPGSIYFDFERIGFNARPTEFVAAVALASFEYFEETFSKRVNNREYLSERIDSKVFFPFTTLPNEIATPHAYPLIYRDHKADIAPLYRHMEESGIQVKNMFGSLPTNHEFLSFLGHSLGDFPVAERLFRTGLHFGIHEGIAPDDLDFIVQTIENFF